MNKPTHFRLVGLLSAILFVALSVIQVVVYKMDVLFSSYFTPFSFYSFLTILRCSAYILLAVALVRAKQDNLFVFAFTLPVAISLIALILHYQKMSSLLDLAVYGSLYFTILGACGYIPKCKKAAQYLCLLPGMIGVARIVFYFSFSLTGIVFSICYVLALLVTSIWAFEQTRIYTPHPPVPVTKLPGIGLITFGALFLISRAVNSILYYYWYVGFWAGTGVEAPFTFQRYLGASAYELLLSVIVCICAIYGGILLYYKKPPEA